MELPLASLVLLLRNPPDGLFWAQTYPPLPHCRGLSTALWRTSSSVLYVEDPLYRTVKDPLHRTVEDLLYRTVDGPLYRNVEDRLYCTVEDRLYRTVENPLYRTVEDPLYRTVEDLFYRNVEDRSLLPQCRGQPLPHCEGMALRVKQWWSLPHNFRKHSHCVRIYYNYASRHSLEDILLLCWKHCVMHQ